MREAPAPTMLCELGRLWLALDWANVRRLVVSPNLAMDLITLSIPHAARGSTTRQFLLMSGLPIGLQIVGPRWAEAALL